MIFRTIDARRVSRVRIAEIAELMIRQEDRDELTAYSGKTPATALYEAIHSGGPVWMTADIKQERLIAIFGVHESRTLYGGIIWAVLTPNVYNCIRAFHRVSKIILDHWLDKYEVLHNYVDARNEAHLRWLRYLGFTFPGTTDISIRGIKFKYFFKEK